MIARWLTVLAVTLMFVLPVQALEIAGVDVAEEISQSDGTILQLNGTGLRSKFVIKVYLAMLYLENKRDNAESVINDAGGKQMIMHFLYSKVGKEDLVEAWNEGFKNNGSPQQLDTLKDEMETFNAMFEAVKKGDRIILDYIPETGTQVTIANQERGSIPGKAFNDLLLSIWLGKKPVGKDLRKGLLGK